MTLFSLGGAFSSLIVVATEEEEELAAVTSEAAMQSRRCVALPAFRFASVIAASRENSDSGEEATLPPVVLFVAVLAVAAIFPLHASSPSSSDWTSGGSFANVVDIFLTK